MVPKPIKRSLSSLIIKEMELKLTRDITSHLCEWQKSKSFNIHSVDQTLGNSNSHIIMLEE